MKKEKNEKIYYYFNADGTLGYVGEAKMKRMIEGWDWEEADFVEKKKIEKLFTPKNKNNG